MAHFRIEDVWALAAGRRVVVAGQIMSGEVAPGMIARGAQGFTAVVRAVDFAHHSAGRAQVALDLGSPASPEDQEAWLKVLDAQSDLELNPTVDPHP